MFIFTLKSEIFNYILFKPFYWDMHLSNVPNKFWVQKAFGSESHQKIGYNNAVLEKFVYYKVVHIKMGLIRPYTIKV